MTKRTVLITGATGILGSWVLGEALDRGYRAVVLMRDPDRAEARRRLAAVMQFLGKEASLESVRIVLGDACWPNLGISPAEADELRSAIGMVIHCAACTKFGERHSEQVWATNVRGVENVIRFLQGSDAAFYHVSTAYVAGNRRGRILETELDGGQQFRNMYERSKYEAEAIVRQAFAEERLRGGIFRPGIIVGDSREGRISQFLNVYSFLRLADLAESARMNGHARLRLRGNPHAEIGLASVDWISEALWRIIEADGPAGKTYHLTNPNPCTLQDLQTWANSFVASGKVRLEFTEAPAAPLTPIEAAIDASFRSYLPYMTFQPTFDRTHTDRALAGTLPFPVVGPELLTTLLHYARQRRWTDIFGVEAKPGNLGITNGASA